MSRIHFIGGEKGGVGKSVMARVLSQYFIDRSIGFSGFDADESHGALMRYYTEYSRPVRLSSFEGADQIMDLALAEDRRVLVDLPAQSERPVQRWMEESEVLDVAREMSVALVFWHITDGGYDSVVLLDRLLDAFGNAGELATTIVVRNFGRSSKFSQFDESEARARLDAGGGRVIDLPELDPAAMYKVDRYGSSLWAAVNSQGQEQSLTAMERRRAKRWLTQCYQQLDAVAELL